MPKQISKNNSWPPGINTMRKFFYCLFDTRLLTCDFAFLITKLSVINVSTAEVAQTSKTLFVQSGNFSFSWDITISSEYSLVCAIVQHLVLLLWEQRTLWSSSSEHHHSEWCNKNILFYFIVCSSWFHSARNITMPIVRSQQHLRESGDVV